MTEPMNFSKISKAMDKGGYHLGCVLKIHDFNKKRICRKCKFVEKEVAQTIKNDKRTNT